MIWLKSALIEFVAAIATIIAIVLASTVFYVDAGALKTRYIVNPFRLGWLLRTGAEVALMAPRRRSR